MEISQNDINEMEKFDRRIDKDFDQVKKESDGPADGGIGYLIRAVSSYNDTDSDYVNRFKAEIVNDATTISHQTQENKDELRKDTLSFISAEESRLSSLTADNLH